MKVTDLTNAIFKNWQAKLFSFGLAVLLYAAFQIITLDTKSFTIPLKIRSGGNYITTDAVPDFVRVEFRGEVEDIASVQDSNVEAYIDISTVSTSGETSVPVGLELSENIILMDTIEVNVTPDILNLHFEENILKWIPVAPIFMGSVPDGYELKSWSSSPTDARVMGAKSIIDSIHEVYADGIDLNNKTKSFTMEVPLTSISEKSYLISAENASIFVEIIPQVVTVSFEGIVPTPKTLLEGFSLSSEPLAVNFELTGEKNVLSQYVPVEETLTIDLSTVTETGEYTFPIVTSIPSYFTLDSISVSEVTVQIIETPLETESSTDEVVGNIPEGTFTEEQTLFELGEIE